VRSFGKAPQDGFSLQRRGTWLARATRQNVYRSHGFTLIELMVVIIVAIVLFAMAIPTVVGVTRSFRIAGDSRGVATELSLARMRAASGNAKTRLNFNLLANTYQVEVWSVSGTPLQPCSAGASGCAWNAEGGVETLSQGDTFGYGTIVTPAGQQSTIGQTNPIYFNSRGFATDSSGNPIATSAIYITNGTGLTSAVAVSIAGTPTQYQYSGSAWLPF